MKNENSPFDIQKFNEMWQMLLDIYKALPNMRKDIEIQQNQLIGLASKFDNYKATSDQTHSKFNGKLARLEKTTSEHIIEQTTIKKQGENMWKKISIIVGIASSVIGSIFGILGSRL